MTRPAVLGDGHEPCLSQNMAQASASSRASNSPDFSPSVTLNIPGPPFGKSFAFGLGLSGLATGFTSSGFLVSSTSRFSFYEKGRRGEPAAVTTSSRQSGLG